MWTLLLSRLSDPAGNYFDRRQFDSGEIRIGRSAKSCDIVLANDDGFVSREHCTIMARGLDLFVTDISKNGVALNDPSARIVPHQPVQVRPNDRLLINDFVITIMTMADAQGARLAPPQSGPALGDYGAVNDIWSIPAPEPFGKNDFGLGDNAIHDFLAGGNAFLDTRPQRDEPAPFTPHYGLAEGMGQAFQRPIMADPSNHSNDFGIPEDWAIAPARLDPVAPDLPLPSRSDPFADPFARATAAPPVAAPFPAAQPGFDPFSPGVAERPQSFADPFMPSVPGRSPAPANANPPVPQARLPAPASGPDWAAFYEGAGLTPEDLALPPDAMHRLGVMYRQVVLGLCDILQDRAAFKDEFRVERTQLSIGRNNPLKHLPAIDAAKVLLGPPLPGFMGSEDALRTSFEDLKKHQLAMLAGVQQAMMVAFDRLAPAEIQKLTEKAGAGKKGLLGRRSPDTWAIYVTVFEALKRDATSNANGVMSMAFREGYEKFMKSVF
ncbi:type VI secretion system-associated FHA domain protein TagH [Novosphingobium sp.]|uniref:type VI secretion system-associated FHA domain protein TagH n=1 Tax=Novosphingobium sp. TaxID=1874826 RepID=UPI0025D83A6B|nr:type VI secretion system-associated FHA domain protein TagH [Novosphingobium sp.]